MPSSNDPHRGAADRRHSSHHMDDENNFAPAFARARRHVAMSPSVSRTNDDADTEVCGTEYWSRSSCRSDRNGSKGDPLTISDRSSFLFAPAFANRRLRLGRSSEENVNRSTSYAYMRQTQRLRDDAADPWSWKATGNTTYMTADGTTIAPEVHEQFVSEQEVMQPDVNVRSDFEELNAHLLGNPGATRIVSRIGSQEHVLDREFDDRITYMDRYGNYIDGIDRGRPPKRHIEEQQRRIAERDEELKHANSALDEWNSLTVEQQDERRKKKAENKRLLDAALVMEEEIIDDLPEIHDSEHSVGDAIIAWRARKLDQDIYMTQKPKVYDRPLTELHEQISDYQAKLTHDEGTSADESLFLPMDDSTSEVMISSGSSPLHRASPALSTLEEAWQPPTSNAIYRKLPHRHHPSTQNSQWKPSRRDEPRLSSSQSIPTLPPVIYRFKNHPPFVPPEEISTKIGDLSLTEDDELLGLARICEEHPRVVSLALMDENVSFNRAAFVSRIFGGPIQEFQFSTESRQAVAVFVKPKDARVLVQHVAAAGKESAHEYRRLQIAADWYQGDASKAILFADQHILHHTLKQDATRTLLVEDIHREISKEMLFASLKSQLLQQNIVRARLLQPSKKYELEVQHCNSIEVEFESIPQAVEAKSRFESNTVAGFSNKPVRFITDKASCPPVQQPWCKCPACSRDPATDTARSRRVLDPNEGMGFIVMQREQRREGIHYNPEQDALVADSFVKDHEDVKRPRLNDYDVHGMRRFAAGQAFAEKDKSSNLRRFRD